MWVRWFCCYRIGIKWFSCDPKSKEHAGQSQVRIVKTVKESYKILSCWSFGITSTKIWNSKVFAVDGLASCRKMAYLHAFRYLKTQEIVRKIFPIRYHRVNLSDSLSESLKSCCLFKIIPVWCVEIKGNLRKYHFRSMWMKVAQLLQLWGWSRVIQLWPQIKRTRWTKTG